MRSNRVLRALVGATVTVAGLAALPGTAHAQTFVPCSATALVNAINDANAAGGGTLALSPLCTYTLTAPDNTGAGGPNGLPVITTPITIVGAFDAIERSTAAGTPAFRIFQIEPPNGSLSLVDTTVRNGLAAPGDVGGGIWLHNGGKLHTYASTITNNQGSDSGGGGIDNDGGDVTVVASTLSNNTSPYGGGMDMDGGSAKFVGSRVTGNTATIAGGGIWGGGVLTLVGTTVTDNTAPQGGGIDAAGPSASITGSNVSNNTATAGGAAGGGIFVDVNNTMTIIGSNISNNKAPTTGSQGGGIYNNSGNTTLTGSRVTGNSASDGGGVYVGGGSVKSLNFISGNSPNNCAPPGSVLGCA